MTDIFPVEVAEGRILFGVIRTAIRAANYNYKKKNDRAVLIWNDTIKDADYFSTLRPWQVVNRLPAINIICRKAPLVRLIHRIQPYFPHLYNFLPKSYILPIQNSEFNHIVSKHEKKYIVKTDNGSLGLGITIIDEKKDYTPVSHLSIGQEYIESCLVDQTKFDCRIYVLVTSIEDLQIYVYRGGVSRFCSQKNWANTIYSQITNTHINRKNPGTTIDKITRMVSETFDQLAKQGVDIELLWKKIDQIATLTILSAYSFLSQSQKKKCQNYGYSRCFQILGFDILIDKNYNPKLLEVNYRPSLERDTDAEGMMKCEMLSEAMKIAVPLNEIQKRLSKNKINYNENGWKNFLIANPAVLEEIEKQKKINLKESHFVQAYPSSDPQQNYLYKEIIQKVESLPTVTDKKYRLPLLPSIASDINMSPVQNLSLGLPPINNNCSGRSNSNEVVFLQLSDSGGSLGNSQIKKSSSNVVSVNFNIEAPKTSTNAKTTTNLNSESSKAATASLTSESSKIETNLNNESVKVATIGVNSPLSRTNMPENPNASCLRTDSAKSTTSLSKSSSPVFVNGSDSPKSTASFNKISSPDSQKSARIESPLAPARPNSARYNRNFASRSSFRSANEASAYRPKTPVRPINASKSDHRDQGSDEDVKYYILTEPDENSDSYKENEIKRKKEEKERKEQEEKSKRKSEDKNTPQKKNTVEKSKNDEANDIVYFIIGETNESSMRLGTLRNGCYINNNIKVAHESNSPTSPSTEKSLLPRLKNSPTSSVNSPSYNNQQNDPYKDSPKMPSISKKYTLSGH